MKKVIATLFLFLIFSFVQGTGSPQGTRMVFALSLVHSANSQSVTFAILTMNNNTIVKTQFLTWRDFIMQATGEVYSVVNTKRENLFEKNGISDCTPLYDTIMRKYYDIYCPVLYDLWKLRYRRDPFHADMRQSTGWAQLNYGPSLAQMKMLSDSFGIKTMNDYFIDDKLFKLLRLTQDTAFVNLYKRQ